MLSFRKLTLAAALLVAIVLPFAVLAQTPTPHPITPTPTIFLTETPVPDNALLQYGDTIQATFATDRQSTEYTFTGHKGDIVGIQFQAFASAGISVRTSVGELRSGVALSTSTTAGYNLSVLPFPLPDDGTYTILIGYTAASKGSYRLHLFKTTPELILPGKTVEGDLTADESAAYYIFNGKAGETVSIALNSNDFDSSLVVSPFKTLMFRTGDKHAGSSNALIAPYTLLVDGQYIIVVTSPDGVGRGHYSLRFNSLDVPMLTYGDSVQAAITKETPFLYYHFEAKKGDLVNIHVASGGSVDTQLGISDFYNNPLASDDDSADGFDPELLNLIIGQDGTYGIKLTPYRFGASGTVTLTLTQTLPISLDNGPQDIYVSGKQSLADAIFTATANEHIRLHLELSNDVNPAINVIQGDKTLGSVSLTGFPTIIADFVVPEAGVVKIEVSSYQECSIHMWVERLENSP